jgi:hypothetical protein
MDVKGAQELARRLEQQHGVSPPVPPRKRLIRAGAAPIFHWFGIEPVSARDSELPDDDPELLAQQTG